MHQSIIPGLLILQAFRWGICPHCYPGSKLNLPYAGTFMEFVRFVAFFQPLAPGNSLLFS